MLLEEDTWYAWFLQDGATAHKAEKTMDVLARFFEDKIITKGRWPTRSPDLTPPDFFLWIYLKNNVYWNTPSLELKMEIEVQICAIDENTCKCVFENMIRWLDVHQEIRGEGGGHLQHNL